MSKGQMQCGGAFLVIAIIIGVSHVMSPSEDAAAAAATPGKVTATSVTALTDKTFDAFAAAHPDGILVDFFSPSCKFCVKLAPEFEKAAKELKAGGPPLVSVDSETGAEIVQRYGIERYPTVLWLWKGQNVLELPRASEKAAPKLVEWAKWATTPAVQELEQRSEFDEALPTLRSTLHAKARLLVAFNMAAGADGLRDAFEGAAQRGRATTVFLYIKDGNSDGPMLKSFGPAEADDEDYKGALTAEEVIAWVKANLEKAKPPAGDAAAKAEDAKPPATQALDAVQKALENAEAAKANAGAEE